MYELKLQNLKNNSIFKKRIDSPYLFNKFLKKCSKSKNIKVLFYSRLY